jgi:hypothetical protein
MPKSLPPDMLTRHGSIHPQLRAAEAVLRADTSLDPTASPQPQAAGTTRWGGRNSTSASWAWLVLRHDLRWGSGAR